MAVRIILIQLYTAYFKMGIHMMRNGISIKQLALDTLKAK